MTRAIGKTQDLPGIVHQDTRLGKIVKIAYSFHDLQGQLRQLSSLREDFREVYNVVTRALVGTTP
jgi:hypothetical protein